MQGGRLLLADQEVLAVPGAPDGPVVAGIRPEGFEPDAGGGMACALSPGGGAGPGREHGLHPPGLPGDTLRAILRSGAGAPAQGTVRFALRPEKVFLFDPDTEARIPFDAAAAR